MNLPREGVLMMAYGSAPALSDQAIRDYLRHILQHYRKSDPTEAEFAHLKKRYEAIGKSPLYPVTEAIVSSLQNLLDSRSPARFRTYLAMKHSPPFIEEVVARMGHDGIEHALAVALAPFPSRLSTEGYYRLVGTSNRQLEHPIDWEFADKWNLHPLFLDLWEKRIHRSFGSYSRPPVVVFTNHSLPARIQEWNDPYAQEFETTAAVLADRCNLPKWDIAFQSEGGGNQPWLGPPLKEVIEQWKGRGESDFLAVPVGFLMDHLETLYDLDIEAQSQAAEMGVALSRTEMPNDDPMLVKLLVDLVLKQQSKPIPAIRERQEN